MTDLARAPRRTRRLSRGRARDRSPIMSLSHPFDLARWSAEADALPDVAARPTLPIHVIAEEAQTVAAFTAKYWLPITDPKTKSVLRPGLKLAVRRPRAASTAAPVLHAKTPDD